MPTTLSCYCCLVLMSIDLSHSHMWTDSPAASSFVHFSNLCTTKALERLRSSSMLHARRFPILWVRYGDQTVPCKRQVISPLRLAVSLKISCDFHQVSLWHRNLGTCWPRWRRQHLSLFLSVCMCVCVCASRCFLWRHSDPKRTD